MLESLASNENLLSNVQSTSFYAVTLFNPDAGENGAENVEVLLGPDLSPVEHGKSFMERFAAQHESPLRSGGRGKTRYPQGLRGSVDLTVIARLAGPSQGRSAARADLKPDL